MKTRDNKYYGVPEGWSAVEIRSAYLALGGVGLKSLSSDKMIRTPSWIIERDKCHRYLDEVRAISQLVKQGDKAAIEMGVRYIELDYFGFFSGYEQTRLARRLKSQELTPDQKVRLIAHFDDLIKTDQCKLGFRDYLKLRRRIEGGE